MPSAPLVPTSQSRKKQKIHHDTGKSRGFDENKENHGSETIPDLPPPLLKTYRSAPVKDEDLPLPALPFPATPANRIPLDDLVGNTEDAFNRPTLATTPNDCVTWQDGPRSSDPSSSYHTTQRSRKRPRSSSPSSQLEKSNHFSAQKDSLNMDSMQKSLRTPQNDPSVDLWTRYAGGNASKSIGQTSALSGLAHLLPSSPQTPSTTDSRGRSIRRVVSCGTEWPTTEAKKRKTPPKSHARVKDIFAASKKRMFSPELPRSGRVGLLLEKIQESFSTKPVEEAEDDAQGPSSSSPIPDGYADEETCTNAPESLLPPARPVFKLEENLPAVKKAARQQSPAVGLLLHNASSSDYGGDEIDYDFVEQVEFAATQTISNITKTQKTPSKPEKPPLKHAIKPAIRPCNANTAQQASMMAANHSNHAPFVTVNRAFGIAAVKVAEDSSDDEFGLDDVDFAEELGDLAAKYESQYQQARSIQQPARVPDQAVGANKKVVAIPQGDGSDEFDDPYDDDVWTDIANGSIDRQIIDSVGSTSQVRGAR
jgi:hypothetical protein